MDQKNGRLALQEAQHHINGFFNWEKLEAFSTCTLPTPKISPQTEFSNLAKCRCKHRIHMCTKTVTQYFNYEDKRLLPLAPYYY